MSPTQRSRAGACRTAAGPLRTALRLLLLVALLPAAPGTAGPAGGADLAPADIDARVAETERAKDLPAEEKPRVLALYAQARTALQAARRHAEVSADFRAAGESAPEEAVRLRSEAAALAEQPPAPEVPGVSASTSAAEIERLLAREEVAITGLESDLARLDAGRREQRERPVRLREELSRARAAQEDLRERLRAGPAADAGPARAAAEETLTRAHIQAHTAELERLEQEILSHDARLAVIEARRDLAASRLDHARARASWLQAQLAEARRAEAAAAVERAAQAEQQARTRHPVVHGAAQENATLAGRLPPLAAALDRVTQARQATEDRARALEDSQRITRRKFELAGDGAALARLLVQERSDLRRLLTQRTRAAQRLLRAPDAGPPGDRAAVELEAIAVEEQRRALADRRDALAGLMDRVEPTMPAAERQGVQEAVLALLRDRLELLARIDAGLNAYGQALAALDAARTRLDTVGLGYAAYLDERLLWIPSATPSTGARRTTCEPAPHGCWTPRTGRERGSPSTRTCAATPSAGPPWASRCSVWGSPPRGSAGACAPSPRGYATPRRTASGSPWRPWP